jgi:DNA-binding HxlR family transcriptional regulator
MGQPEIEPERHAKPAELELCIIPSFPHEVDKLSLELMSYIADKWTLLVFEELAEQGTMRFNELRKAVPGISQKMLTQTLRQLERIGLVTRTVHAEIPPRVEYGRTELGQSLGPVICGLWTWVEQNVEAMEHARQRFDRLNGDTAAAR